MLWWIPFIFGSSFALAGLGIWVMGSTQYIGERRRRQSARAHPDEPVFADYPWNPLGFEAPRWSKVLKAVTGLTFLTFFSLLPNLLAFTGTTPW